MVGCVSIAGASRWKALGLCSTMPMSLVVSWGGGDWGNSVRKLLLVVNCVAHTAFYIHVGFVLSIPSGFPQWHILFIPLYAVSLVTPLIYQIEVVRWDYQHSNHPSPTLAVPPPSVSQGLSCWLSCLPAVRRVRHLQPETRSAWSWWLAPAPYYFYLYAREVCSPFSLQNRSLHLVTMKTTVATWSLPENSINDAQKDFYWGHWS